MTEHIYREPLTTEEDTAARQRQFEERDYALLKAFELKGVRVASRGHDFIVLNPELLGFKPLSTDDEHRELSLPRVVRRGLYLPVSGQTRTTLDVCDTWTKTVEKRREFYSGCEKEPTLPQYIVIEAGAEFERRAIAAAAKDAEELALQKVKARPGEPLRGVVLECRDDALATELVETMRDQLPWAEGLELRPDGELPVGWHGCALSRDEQERLKEQAGRDRRAMRERRAKVIRSMQREPY